MRELNTICPQTSLAFNMTIFFDFEGHCLTRNGANVNKRWILVNLMVVCDVPHVLAVRVYFPKFYSVFFQ